MDLQLAQETTVHRYPQLFSDDDISELHALAAGLEIEAATESRGDEKLPADAWIVKYLHTDNYFATHAPGLLEKLRTAVVEADLMHGWGLVQSAKQFNVRCAEYHRLRPPGSLSQPGHYDKGSLITIDVMLQRPGEDFEGGVFTTHAPGHYELGSDKATLHTDFMCGDALIFVSHKAHCVSPVTAGTRRVFVVEFWDGPARSCPHRCEELGECRITVANIAQKNKEDFEETFLSLLDKDVLKAAMEALREEDSG